MFHGMAKRAVMPRDGDSRVRRTRKRNFETQYRGYEKKKKKEGKAQKRRSGRPDKSRKKGDQETEGKTARRCRSKFQEGTEKGGEKTRQV